MSSTASSAGGPQSRPAQSTQPVGGIRFDWIMALLGGWWTGGAYLDGWAHRHDKVDESFFTPWHAILYSAFLLSALVLLVSAYRNRRGGYRVWNALPPGYEWALSGTLIFALAGVGDLVWHTLFGIEVSTEALLSPTHLLLALGAILVMSGPLRAAARRTTPAESFVSLLPALLSLAWVLSTLSFMTQFAHPLVDARAANDPGVRTISQLYAMNADGSAQTRLSNDPQVQYWHPSYSPDGRRIAYAAGASRTLQITVANADGSNPTRLTYDQASNVSPNWSPDGSQLIFSSAREGKFQVYVMNADGSNQTRLTRGESNLYAAWSPDARRIAFTGIRDGNWQVYVMNADGSGETRLTEGGAGNYFPQWSPDGRQLVFVSRRDGQNQIYVMNADGSGQRRLTDNTADERFARWSPRGDKIVFASRRDGYFDIYTMNPDGTGQTNLTRNPGMESGGQQSWSPDGSKIIFTAESHQRLTPFLAEEAGIASILLQTALLAGLILPALRRWRLPPGSLTLVFTLNSLLLSVLHDQYQFILSALVAGVLGDLLLWWLRPSPARHGVWHLFAFLMPAAYFAVYFLVVSLTKGIAWSVHLWAGSIALAGIVGVMLSVLLMLPMDFAEQRAAT